MYALPELFVNSFWYQLLKNVIFSILNLVETFQVLAEIKEGVRRTHDFLQYLHVTNFAQRKRTMWSRLKLELCDIQLIVVQPVEIDLTLLY
jgi:hypothetical protein